MRIRIILIPKSINTYFKNATWYRVLYKYYLIFINKTNVMPMIGKHSWVLTHSSLQVEMKFDRRDKNWDPLRRPWTTSVGILCPLVLSLTTGVWLLVESAVAAPHMSCCGSRDCPPTRYPTAISPRDKNPSRKSSRPLVLIAIIPLCFLQHQKE